MTALALNHVDTFQTIDNNELALVGGAFSFGQMVDAGNAAAPAGRTAGGYLGPMIGAGVGAAAAAPSGPGMAAGAVAGAGAGAALGPAIGGGLGWLGGAASNAYSQLTQ